MRSVPVAGFLLIAACASYVSRAVDPQASARALALGSGSPGRRPHDIYGSEFACLTNFGTAIRQVQER